MSWAAELDGRVGVAAGILVDDRGRLLLAQRPHDPAFPGLWEFPGGKLAPGESPRQALYRELHEELGIRVCRCRRLMTVDHDYPARRVRLYFYVVTAWTGEVSGRIGQDLRWVALDALESGQLLPANAPVVPALRRRTAAISRERAGS